MIGLIGKDLKIGFLKDLVLSMHQGINTVADKIEYVDEGEPILQSKHITKGFVDISNVKFVHPKMYDKYFEKYNPSPNNILVCNIGTIGKNVRVIEKRKFLIAWNLFLIKLNEDLLDSKYFSHYLDYLLIKKYYDRFLTGGTVKFINKKTMGNIPIPLPPLKTQQRIAAILDDAAALRDKTAQLLTEYDLLSQSIFLEMFGDPVGNTKNIPKISLGELTEVSSGSTPSRKDDDNFNGDIPWVKTGEVNSTVITDTEEKITKKGMTNSRLKLYKKGSLIIAMYGQGKTRGKVAILGIPATTNQACAVLAPSEIVNFTYLYEHIKMVYEDLRSLGRGGGQPNLNSRLIKDYMVLNPPIELQNEFAHKIVLIEQQKALAKQELQESEDLFNCLLQQAFKGELL
jgi:type I restriction enzyme S subunit